MIKFDQLLESGFNDSYTIKDCIAIAKMAWEEAMQKPEKNKRLESYFSLVEIGLSKGWFESKSKDFFDVSFDMFNEVDQRLEKTWMDHLIHRAYIALGLKVSFHKRSVEIPENAKADEALNYLCKLVKYFQRLGNHDELIENTCTQMFNILAKKPIDIDESSKVFTLILSCFTDQQLEGRKWALRRMKESILANEKETPPKKIQLLLVIQNDYKTLGNLAAADETLDNIIELIKTLPQEEKKPWVEKAASALYQLQLYEKAKQLIEKYNASIEELADRIPLLQSIFLGALALSTCFVRPFHPLCASVLVTLVPKLLLHRT